MSERSASLSAGAPATAPTVVARIPYLNAEPFYALWDRLPGTSVDLPPRLLGEQARAGAADAGLMAVADWFALEDQFERVEDFGIACDGPVASVLLFSRRPVASLAGATIEVTDESSTSVELLALLLEAQHGLEGVRYVRRPLATGYSAESGADAWLLIGDAALRARTGGDDGVVVTDLGRAWRDWTKLPFVYAVWTIRAGLPMEVKARFREFLAASLEAGRAAIPDLARAAAARGLGTAGFLEAYLRGFRYRLGPRELHGLARFRSLWRERRTRGGL